jgi:hypothetical protein
MRPALFASGDAMPLFKRDTPERPGAAVATTRDTEQRARIAQVLLVARLRARNRRDLAVDSLERAAQVILVTCKNWFSSSRSKTGPAAAGPVDPASADAPIEKNTDSHAHRNH